MKRYRMSGKTVKLTLTEQDASFLNEILKQFSRNSKSKAKYLNAVSKYESGMILNDKQQKDFEENRNHQRALSDVLIILADTSDRINEKLCFEMVKKKIKLKK